MMGTGSEGVTSSQGRPAVRVWWGVKPRMASPPSQGGYDRERARERDK